MNRVLRRGGRFDPALHEAPRLVHFPAVPRRVGCEQDRFDDARRLFLALEDLSGRLGLAKRGVRVTRHARGLREKETSVAFQHLLAFPFLVPEVIEGGLRDARRLLRAEGVEGLFRELQAVVHGFPGHVALREVVDELGVHAVEASLVALFEEVRVRAVERAALPPREGAVEDVAHDAAREREPVAARLALLLEEAFLDEPVDRLVEVFRVLRDRLEVLELEALPENRRDREDVAYILREPLDSRLDGLLDRLGKGVGGDARRPREIQRARVVPRDPARIEKRPDELLREERISFRRREEPPGEIVRELAAAGGELHEGPVLGRRERAEDERREAGISAEGLEHLHEGMPLVDLRLPVRPHDEGRRRAEAPRDVLERLDRKLRPVQLLEGEEKGLASGDSRERTRDELEDRDLVLGLPVAGLDGSRIAARRGAQLADLGEDREEREEVAREVGEIGAGGFRKARVLRPEIVLDELAEALVRERAVVLDEASRQDADLAGAREALELVHEPALADAGLAGEDDELALARDGGVEPALQLGHLLLTPDERGRHGRARQHPAGREDDGAAELLVAELAPVAPERLGEVPGPLRPLLGVLREALEDGGLQLLAHVGAEGPHRLRQLVDDAIEDRLHLAREGGLAREAFVEHRPERVDVRAPVERPRRDLLGAEIDDGPDQRPGLGQAILARREGEAEIHDPGPDVAGVVARGHDVLGLDVAVDDAAGVAVIERVGDLRPDVEHVAEAQRPLAQKLAEVRVREHRHDEEERSLVPPEVVDRHDGRVVHLRDDLGFPLESLLGVLREIPGRDELHGDVAVQDRILRAIDDTHPAAPQLGKDLVAVGELCTDHACAAARPV